MLRRCGIRVLVPLVLALLVADGALTLRGQPATALAGAPSACNAASLNATYGFEYSGAGSDAYAHTESEEGTIEPLAGNGSRP